MPSAPDKWTKFASGSMTGAQLLSALGACATDGYTGPSVTVPCTDGTFTFVAGYDVNPSPPTGYVKFSTASMTSAQVLTALNNESASGYSTTANYAACTDGNFVFVGGY